MVTAALAGPPLIAWLSLATTGVAFVWPRELALQVVYCALAVFILWFIVAREKLGLDSIGLHRPTGRTLYIAVLIYACGIILQIVIAPLLALLDGAPVERGMETLRSTPIGFRVVLALTGGAIEELLYRGYAIERLAMITRSRWSAAIISTGVFALAHIPLWGWGYALLADLPFGLVMAAFYLWKRDLAANMLAHSTGLLIAMVSIGT